MIVQILKKATEESDNPDLRTWGFIYWRMLSTDPEMLQKIVLAEKQPITGDSYNFDGPLLEKLVSNIGTLSSIYSKPPEQFVKKIHDRIVEWFDTEFIEEEVVDDMDSTGQKKDTYQAQDNIAGFGNLLDLDGGDSTPTINTDNMSNVSSIGSGIDELLSMGTPAPSKVLSDPLAELMGMSMPAPSAPAASLNDDILGFMGAPTPVLSSEYCWIPDK